MGRHSPETLQLESAKFGEADPHRVPLGPVGPLGLGQMPAAAGAGSLGAAGIALSQAFGASAKEIGRLLNG